MASNPFDQFDGQSNPFDSFDAPKTIDYSKPRTADQIPSKMVNGVQTSTDPRVILSDYGRTAKPAPGQTYESAGLKYQEPSASDYMDSAKQAGLGVLRFIGRTGRNVAQGAPALLGMVTDAPARIYEGITGNAAPALTKPYQAYAQALDSPELADKTAGERLQSDLVRGVAGVYGSAGMAAPLAIPAGAAPTATNLVAKQLASNLPAQTTAAIGSSMAGGTTRELGGGNTAQFLASLAGGMAPGVANQLWTRAIGEPSSAAKTLLNKDVDLTPGQQNSKSAYAQIEDASQHLPIIGNQFKNAREAAQTQAKEAFIAEAAAPGVKVPLTGDLQQTLKNVGDTFEPAYDQVSGFPLRLKGGQPIIMNQGKDIPLSDAFNKAVANKGILATNETRQTAQGFLDNLLSLPVKNSEDLLAMRSAIRAQARNLAGDQSLQARGLQNILDAAEGKVTEAIQSQLPPGLLQKLIPVDQQYAKYKTAVDAMAKGGDRPGGFTFNQASQAAKTSATNALGKDAYAKGQGFMRQIPAAAQEVFASRPQTGASLTAQAAAWPLLPFMVPLSLTRAGRSYAANNVIAPYQFPASGLVGSLNELTPEDRRKLIAQQVQ